MNNLSIIGHYNPHYEYPCVVIPVVLDECGSKSLLYKSNNDIVYKSLPHQFIYTEYSKGLLDELSGFDFKIETLFAYSEDKVEKVLCKDLGNFLLELFELGVFDDVNPFLTVPYAIKTENNEVIRRNFRTCVLELGPKTEFAQKWYASWIRRNELIPFKHSLPDNASKLLDDLPCIRIGVDSDDLSLIVRRLARSINNASFDISDRRIWIKPDVDNKYSVCDYRLYQNLDVYFSGVSDDLQLSDFNAYMNSIKSFMVGRGELVIALDENTSFLSKDIAGKRFEDVLRMIVKEKDVCLWLPYDASVFGDLVQELVDALKTKNDIPVEFFKKIKRYSCVKELFKRLRDDDNEEKGDYLIIAERHAVLSAFSQNSIHSRPALLGFKDDIAVPCIEYKAFLLNPNSVEFSSVFSKLERHLTLQRVSISIEKSGLVRSKYDRSLSENNVRLLQRLLSESSDTLFKGDIALYKELRPLKEREYARTVLAAVEERLCADECRTTGLQSGDMVVIKYPRPLSNGFSFKDKREHLELINDLLRREHRSISKLVGATNIAQAYDEGDVFLKSNGTEHVAHFIVHQFIEGKRLSELDEELPSRTAKDFFKWARILTEALKRIHQAGVVHGDIWPDNIILNNDGDPVFVDFGQAILRTETPPSKYESENTLFISPEKDYTVEGDIYSLCATLYYLATKKQPPNPEKSSVLLKKHIVDGLKKFNPVLYHENSGIADIIAHGMRYYKYNRTPNTQKLLIDIDLFDPSKMKIVDDLQTATADLKEKIELLDKEDPLFADMAKARLSDVLYYVSEMSQGIHDVRGDHDELVVAMTKFMSFCDKGDQYLTASIPWLWYNRNMGINGRLLSCNKRVIVNGAILRRVFIITPDELRERQTLEVLRAHRDMLSEIEHEVKSINTKKWEFTEKGVFTGVLVMSDEDRQELFENSPHSGMWIRYTKENNAKIKVLQPFYDDEDRVMTGVRLKNGDDDVVSIIGEFKYRLLEKSRELRDFLDDYEKFL